MLAQQHGITGYHLWAMLSMCNNNAALFLKYEFTMTSIPTLDVYFMIQRSVFILMCGIFYKHDFIAKKKKACLQCQIVTFEISKLID